MSPSWKRGGVSPPTCTLSARAYSTISAHESTPTLTRPRLAAARACRPGPEASSRNVRDGAPPSSRAQEEQKATSAVKSRSPPKARSYARGRVNSPSPAAAAALRRTPRRGCAARGRNGRLSSTMLSGSSASMATTAAAFTGKTARQDAVDELRFKVKYATV